jgi:hypothetical protein
MFKKVHDRDLTRRNNMTEIVDKETMWFPGHYMQDETGSYAQHASDITRE